jgi:hypothetical protein
VTAGRRRCSLCSVCYMSPWQREWRWVRRGPHAERPGSVGVPGVVVGVCADAPMDLRDRRSWMCSLRATVPWWRSPEGRWFLQRVATRRGTASATTAQVSAACFGLLSHVVGVGGVLCRVCLFLFVGLFVWWCVLRPIMYQCCFFLNDIAMLLL